MTSEAIFTEPVSVKIERIKVMTIKARHKNQYQMINKRIKTMSMNYQVLLIKE